MAGRLPRVARGASVLDLGCGPGLYTIRLARRGMRVVGVDVSRRSLGHLERVAADEGLPVETVHGSYLDADLRGGHDAAILIYEDYCVLSPEQRACLTPAEVEAELAAAGLGVVALDGDVAGAAHDPGAPSFAVVAARNAPRSPRRG